MDIRDAEALIADAVPAGRGVWVDFGAGTGTFTHALANRLDTGSRVYAVDRDRKALSSLAREQWTNGVEVLPVVGDFTQALALPGVATASLDGMLFANSLHFVAQPETVLARLVPLVRVGGVVVIIEYDGRRANRWVPHPIPSDRLGNVVAKAGLSPPVITARRRSAYGGALYVAVAKRRRATESA